MKPTLEVKRPEATGKHLIVFIKSNIEYGSTIVTDKWKRCAESTKYTHEVKAIMGSGKEANELLPHVHIYMADLSVKNG